MLCALLDHWMAFIWHSPHESIRLSGSENMCQAKIRRIGPELRVCVLYNVWVDLKIYF